MVAEAGVGSVLPAASVALTWKVCVPFFSERDLGELQGANVPLSTLQAKLEPASVLWNSTLTSALFFLVVTVLGALVITVSGGVVSDGPGPVGSIGVGSGV